MSNTAQNETAATKTAAVIIAELEEKHGKLIDPREAAIMVGRSTRTLEHWRAHGSGPAYVRLTGRIKYGTLTLATWLRDNIEDVEPTRS